MQCFHLEQLQIVTMIIDQNILYSYAFLIVILNTELLCIDELEVVVSFFFWILCHKRRLLNRGLVVTRVWLH